MMSFILTLLFVLCVAAVVYWMINALTLPAPVKILATGLIALSLLYWLWTAFPKGAIG